MTAAFARGILLPKLMCSHLHDTTSRYDAARKVLTFVLFCPDCGTEKVVQALGYEPQPAFPPATSNTRP